MVEERFVGPEGAGTENVYDMSMKSGDPPTRCEVKVDVKDGDRWVRIPVTMCDLWINKDGPADISRTAKVKFPGEWDGESVTQYINGFQENEERLEAQEGDIINNLEGAFDVDIDFRSRYDECRIWFWDEDLEKYQISHYGYVGGVGPASENGVMKMWVYDPSDLLKRIQVSKSWGQPSIEQVIDFILNGTDEQGKPVGINNRTVFNNVTPYINGGEDIPQTKTSDVREEDTDAFVLTADIPLIGPLRFPIKGIEGFLLNWLEDNVTDPLLAGHKRFQINRHTMVDMVEWFTSLIDARWHFEPTHEGPVLYIDATAYVGGEGQGSYSKRTFVEREVLTDFEEGILDGINSFAPVTTLDNQALYDIKPFNTLYLYGEAAPASQRMQQGNYNVAVETARRGGSAFPYVKVVYPPLVERAGGYEYSAAPIESDKMYLEQARSEAIKEFRKHLAEETEGTITIKGEPHMLPYDHITTIPACEGTFPNVDLPPITYEVNSVKHSRAAEKRYTSELGVSMTFDESRLEVTAEYKEP